MHLMHVCKYLICLPRCSLHLYCMQSTILVLFKIHFKVYVNCIAEGFDFVKYLNQPGTYIPHCELVCTVLLLCTVLLQDEVECILLEICLQIAVFLHCREIHWDSLHWASLNHLPFCPTYTVAVGDKSGVWTDSFPTLWEETFKISSHICVSKREQENFPTRCLTFISELGLNPIWPESWEEKELNVEENKLFCNPSQAIVT